MRLTANVEHCPYSILQLTPTLQSALNDGSLVFRSDAANGSIVACTSHSTFGLRRLNQSNSLLLTDATRHSLHVFASPTSLLEPSPKCGEIDWNKVPMYSEAGFSDDKRITIDKLRENSLCSDIEFEEMLRSKPAAMIDDRLGCLSNSITHSVLVELVSAMVETGDIELVCGEADAVAMGRGEPAILRAVYRKFRRGVDVPGLCSTEVSRWIGLFLLNQHPHEEIDMKLFSQNWSRELPIKVNTNWALLEGHVVEIRPGFVRYIDPESLSTKPKDRFRQLFKLKESWKLAEMAPFLSDLVPVTAKIESWLLKYAKRQQRGCELYITPRKL